jgi:uroporphyrinogen decarboxylase
MTSKERVLKTLRFEEPDRVPTGENSVDFELTEGILKRETLCNARWKELSALWDGRRDEIVRDYIRDHVDLVKTLEWDYVRVPVVPKAGDYPRPTMVGEYSWLDEQGRKVNYHPENGNMATLSENREMTISDLPDPDEDFRVDPSELEAVRGVVAELGESHFIIGRPPVDGTFPYGETCGMEEFLMRMIKDPEFVIQASRVYVKRSLAYIEAMLEAGCHGIMTTDDYCDNKGPIMGPLFFEKFILPGIKKQADLIHSKGGFFIKHTDGNMWKILDMLVEAGIDGWHGIQTSIGMDLARLKAEYGGKICFFGGVNCETLIEGSPEDVAGEVRQAISQAGPGGGFVQTSGNVLQPGVRLENYLTGLKTLKEYGSYPLEV